MHFPALSFQMIKNDPFPKAHRMGPPDPQPSTFQKTPATLNLRKRCKQVEGPVPRKS